jgi:hypothetical protein
VPQFGFGSQGNVGVRTPNTAAASPEMAQMAAQFGAPNAGALAAQTPAPAPPMGQSPQQTGGGGELDALLAMLMGAGGQMGMAGGSPPMAPQPGAPPAPGGAMMPGPGMGVSLPMSAPAPTPQVQSPLLGITPAGEDFPQAFKASTGRYPTVVDYSERAFVTSFVQRVGRYPTKFEMLMQQQPNQRPMDGLPDYEEATQV